MVRSGIWDEGQNANARPVGVMRLASGGTRPLVHHKRFSLLITLPCVKLLLAVENFQNNSFLYEDETRLQ